MAYRDPAEAARERVRQARQEVELLEERITPALLEQMQEQARAELQACAELVSEQLPDDELGGLERQRLLAALPLLARYAEALEQAIERAPRLAKRYNRLPRTFPKRLKTKFIHHDIDIYQRATAARRHEIHAWVRALDPGATLISARPRYDDQVMDPHLAEAELTVERAPLRLQVLPHHSATSSSPYFSAQAYALSVKTRPSTPSLSLELQGLDDRLLKWLGLRDEPQIGHAAFDDLYFIQGTEEDARRLLRPEVHEPLLALASGRADLDLRIEGGLARLQWIDPARNPEGLELGVRTLVAVRKTPPVQLLRRPRTTNL